MEGPAQVNTMDDFAFYLPNSGVWKGVLINATKFDFDLISSSVFSE